MGTPYGFLWFFDASKLFNFDSLLFFASTFSLIFKSVLIYSFVFLKLCSLPT